MKIALFIFSDDWMEDLTVKFIRKMASEATESAVETVKENVSELVKDKKQLVKIGLAALAGFALGALFGGRSRGSDDVTTVIVKSIVHISKED